MFEHIDISYWSKDIISNQDIVIVGAGIVGVNAAISLKERFPSRSILILDQGNGTLGASVRNAGFACFGSVSEILDDVELTGWETALKTVSMRWKGLQLLKSRVGEQAMDYDDCGGIELFDDNELEARCIEAIPELNRRLDPILQNGQCYKLQEGKWGSTIVNTLEGAIHPGKMMSELTAQAGKLGVRFLYGVQVEKVIKEKNLLHTTAGVIKYKKCILTTNAWTSKIVEQTGIIPARNHVLVTSPIDSCPVMGTFHMDRGYIYFRNIGNRVLIGGARNIAQNSETTFDQLNMNLHILEKLKSILSSKLLIDHDYQIEHTWTGLLGVGGDKMPIITKESEHLYLATKMGGMGVAIGSYVGQSVADLMVLDIT